VLLVGVGEMFNLGKKARIRRAAKEILNLILVQSVQFAGRASQKIDETVDTDEGAAFKREFTETDKKFYSHSHIDQTVYSHRGMALLVHCFGRLSYSREGDK